MQKTTLLETWTSKVYQGMQCKARIYLHKLTGAMDVNAWILDVNSGERLSKIHKYTYRNTSLERIIEGLEEINKIQ